MTIFEATEYWRTTLADETRIGFINSSRRKEEEYDQEEIVSSLLNQDKVKRIFDKLNAQIQQKNQRTRAEKEPYISSISVVVAPFVVKNIFSHGAARLGGSLGNFAPLWMPAFLGMDGALSPHPERHLPWIDRRCLEPNPGSTIFPILGSIKKANKFYSTQKNPLEQDSISWREYFQYAQSLLAYVLEHGDIALSLEARDLALQTWSYVVVCVSTQGFSKNLMAFYDQLKTLPLSKIPSLYKNYANYFSADPRETKTEDSALKSNDNLGQITNAYSLTTSQRKCLGASVRLANGEIFSITGPPGTGKTSFIRSVVSSKLVESAIDNKNYPPIIVVSSTNNQAITNVLDGFSNITPESSLLTKRWLPKLTGYGLYLASAAQEKNANIAGYLYQTPGGFSGSLNELYAPTERYKAKIYFLSEASNYFKKNLDSVDEAISLARGQLKECHKRYQSILAKLSKYLGESTKNEHKSPEDNASRISKITDERKKVQISQREIEEIYLHWTQFKSNLLYPKIFPNFWKQTSHYHKIKIEYFCQHYSSFFPFSHKSISDVEKHLLEQTEICARKIQLIQEKMNREQIKATKLQEQNSIFIEELKAAGLTPHNLWDFLKKNLEEQLQKELDVTLRFKMFHLASHYWEGRWLAESSSSNLDALDSESLWGRHAMIAPVFITTLHSGINFFRDRTRNKPMDTLLGFIDYLLIDEAGQVSPAVAGPMIAASKRLIAIGDTNQLQPVFSIPEAIDLENASSTKLFPSRSCKLEEILASKFLCSNNPENGLANGSLMDIALTRSQTSWPEFPVRGGFLMEHFRCRPEIISFCNELCYDNKLLPQKKSACSDLPRLGYAHIEGNSKKQGTSLENLSEATAIASWLQHNSTDLLKNIQTQTGKSFRSLDECVGIITPFKAQSNLIEGEIRNLGLPKIRIGTVHAFQGAEFPIIIFSLVYSKSSQAFFFDRTSQMLNVAVSRAQESFLAFGNMNLLDPHLKRPSSVLAKRLFSEPENEVFNIVAPRLSRKKKLSLIDSLRMHKKVLSEAFVRAEKEVNIVSPFLRKNAIEADDILTIIKSNRKRISINIYTDPFLNSGGVEDEFFQCLNDLSSAGANVFLVKNVHSKILSIDKRAIIQGSFNWLSASRSKNLSRYEASFIYTGEQVKKFIEESLSIIEDRIIQAIPAEVIELSTPKKKARNLSEIKGHTFA